MGRMDFMRKDHGAAIAILKGDLKKEGIEAVTYTM